MLVLLDNFASNHAATHFVKGMRLNLRELVLHVVGVHRPDLVARGRAEDFYDLDQLVNTRFAGEEGLTEHELCHDTTSRPDV